MPLYIKSTLAVGAFLAAVSSLSAQGPTASPVFRPATTPQVDARAVTLLDKANETLFKARTLKGKVQTTRISKGSQAGKPVAIDVWAAKPGSFRVNEGAEVIAGAEPGTQTGSGNADISGLSGIKQSGASTLITGEALEALMAGMKAEAKQVRIHTPERSVSYSNKSDIVSAISDVYFKHDVSDANLQAFFGFQSREIGVWTPGRVNELLLRSVKYVGREDWNGKSYDIVDWTYENAYLMPEDTIVYTTRFYIGSSDHIIHRSVTNSSTGLVTDKQFTLELNAPVTEKDFALPKADMVVKPAAPVEVTSFVGQNLEQVMPQVEGAQLLDQGEFNVRKLLAGKKGALLWLWASGCSQSTAEFPIAERLYREYGARGLSFVALDYYGPTDEGNARKMRDFNRTTIPIAINVLPWTDLINKSSGSVLIVDATGQIVYHGSFDPKAIEAVLEKLAKA